MSDDRFSPEPPAGRVDLPEPLPYRVKRRLLGPPLVTEQLRQERLSNRVALGVLSPDCISSSAYGTEEMLVELLPYAGLAAFTIVLPITGVVLLILVLMTLSYRQVVMVYTKVGGSYVVARENFGPKIAQVAAVALLIDYVVTVAVQSAAGTVAVVSAIPAAGPYSVELTIGVVLVICYGNLRGIREAGRLFALPTYLFITSIGAVIVVGVIRELLGDLPMYHPEHVAGVVHIGHGNGFIAGATILVILRSFANGGSSLTGLEAISDGVSAFREPTGVNARKVLAAMAFSLGFLVAGVSWLAHITHAAPYTVGYPSVISQEARIVFGSSAGGHVLYIIVQAATALILYTGANTSFNGFPYLASFVAADSFLPRQLTKRGHRLAFSNGIIVLTFASIALVAITRARVNSLVPFYAIGVFTGFTMAGLGMARYHSRRRVAGWRPKFAVSMVGGLLSAAVVLIFAISKFTEGAWIVVLLFPILMTALIRLNRHHRAEEAALAVQSPGRPANYARHIVLVFVDTVDLATMEALRYGRNLRPSELRAIHFMIDDMRSERLQHRWGQLEHDISLDVINCPDRRLARAAAELVAEQTQLPRSHVTVLLPRRSYAPLLGRLLHDRTADKIARVVSRLPHAAATIIPFDPQVQLRAAHADDRPAAPPAATRPHGGGDSVTEYLQPSPPPGVTPIGALASQQVVNVEGRVRSTQVRTHAQTPLLACEISDSTGQVTALFYGRREILGIHPGARIRLHGRAMRSNDTDFVIANPSYRLIADQSPSEQPAQGNE